MEVGGGHIDRIFGLAGDFDGLDTLSIMEEVHSRAACQGVNFSDLVRLYFAERMSQPFTPGQAMNREPTTRTMMLSDIVRKSGVPRAWLVEGRSQYKISGASRARYVVDEDLFRFMGEQFHRLPSSVQDRAKTFIERERSKNNMAQNGKAARAETETVLEEVLRFNAAEQRKYDEVRRETEDLNKRTVAQIDGISGEVLKLQRRVEALESEVAQLKLSGNGNGSVRDEIVLQALRLVGSK